MLNRPENAVLTRLPPQTPRHASQSMPKRASSGVEKFPSLLSSLSASLLLLRAVGLRCLLLDTVNLFDHEGTGDSA